MLLTDFDLQFTTTGNKWKTTRKKSYGNCRQRWLCEEFVRVGHMRDCKEFGEEATGLLFIGIHGERP
jgi:hypothetical protein